MMNNLFGIKRRDYRTLSGFNSSRDIQPRVRCATLGWWMLRLRRTLRVIAAIWLIVVCASMAFGQRNLKDIPEPDPDAELASFTVAEGFEVNLFAADPLLASPIQMNFDAEGKLWIASSEVYPHIKPGQKATDKILVLEDTDRDGQADKTTVFADGLLIPTGVLPGDGGVYVVNSTELLHMKDTDDDGKADQRRVMLSGFGTEDTHHLLHTLRWGVDGAIYMNQSIYIHSHVETPHGVKRLNGGGIWRFRPETLELDVFARGFVNSWGHHQDRWGQSFATDGAYGEGINYVFPGARFVAVPGEKRRLKGLNPGSPKHCGLEILSGSHLPPEWRDDMVTNDFRAHRVCRFKITEDGSGYASRQQEEVLKTRHVAFRPIDVKMGPDGAIYIADWYNPIIQHGEVDFRDPRRDHVHGRIWRVTAKDRPLVKRRNFADATIEELLEMLKAQEDWVRLWAKRELKTRDHEEVFTALGEWIEADARNWVPADGTMLEIAWLYQTMNSPGDAPTPLLESSMPQVRAAAVRITSDWSDGSQPWVDAFAKAVHDEYPRVRLAAVRALAKVPTKEAAALAAQALDHPMDRWLDFALWQAMRDLKPYWLPAVERGEFDFDGNVEHLTYALKAVDSPAIVDLLIARFAAQQIQAAQVKTSTELVAELGTAKQIGRLLAIMFDNNLGLTDAQRTEMLTALTARTSQRRLIPEFDHDFLVYWTQHTHQPLQVAAIRATGVWKVKDVAGWRGLAAVGADNPPPAVRKAAIESLAMQGDEASLDLVVAVAERDKDLEVRSFAVQQLAAPKAERSAQLAIDFMATAEKVDHVEQLVTALVSRKGGEARLVKHLGETKLSSDVAKVAIRAVRAAPGDHAAFEAAFRKAGNITSEPKAYSAEELAALVADINEMGDPARGEAVYRRGDMRCIKCHAIAGSGGKVGPDLVSIGASAPVDYLLQSLVDPNAKIKENFHSLIVEDDRGRVHSGIPIQRNDQRIVLRNAEDEEVTIAAANIDVVREGRSLMPEGLVDPLTRAELIDLTRFLSELGKDGDYAVSKDRVVRTWQKLKWTPEGHRRLNRTSHDTAATDDAELTWEPTYSKVSGVLPIDGLPPFKIHREQPPHSFVRFELNVTSAGKVGLKLDDIQGIKLWIADRPASVSPEFAVDLGEGRHRFTLAIDRTARTDPLRVLLVDVEGSPAKAELVTGP